MKIILYRTLLPLLLLPVFALPLLQPGDELLLTSVSPGGSYCLEAHRINPGATEPYAIHVFRTEEGRHEQIYAVRGEDSAEIEWLTEDVVRINQVTLNLSENETFTANARAGFDVVIVLEAGDAAEIVTAVTLGGSARALQGVRNADGSPLENSERFTHRLTMLQEIHWDDDLTRSPAGLTVTVTPADGVPVALTDSYEWTAALGGSYAFRLAGSSADGYALTPLFDDCTPLSH